MKINKGLLDLVRAREILQHYPLLTKSIAIAPSMLADADDTAKTILALNLLGRKVAPDRMLSYFQSKNGHFQTYVGERNPSFSANCNVLMAILHAPGLSDYSSQIESISNFLCDTWFSNAVNDKWVNAKNSACI